MEINKVYNFSRVNIKSSHKIERDDTFNQVLNQKMHEVGTQSPQNPNDLRADILKQGDRILTLLEGYTKALGDPRKSLRDIEPLIRDIQGELAAIEYDSRNKPQGDKDLEKFIRDLSVTVNVAVFKFQRGDYI